MLVSCMRHPLDLFSAVQACGPIHLSLSLILSDCSHMCISLAGYIWCNTRLDIIGLHNFGRGFLDRECVGVTASRLTSRMTYDLLIAPQEDKKEKKMKLDMERSMLEKDALLKDFMSRLRQVLTEFQSYIT